MNTTTTSRIVRSVRASDEGAWHSLWTAFCTFYSVAVPTDVSAATWARLLDDSSTIDGYVAELDGTVVGFANCVLHPYTWGTQPVCYLEDLFVDPAVRSGGVGRALIEHLIELAGTHGWARIYWHTDRENTPARRLYDQFGEADDFVRYTLTMTAEHPPRSAPAL